MVNESKRIAAIGNFDGVHLGHQHLLAEAAALAAQLGADQGVVLFEPHPQRFFQPNGPPFLITLSDQRNELLRASGAKFVEALAFDGALASLSPQEFVQGILVERLGLSGVLTGVDFRFGKARAGDIDALKTLGREAGLEVRAASLLERPDTEKFGSSGIRLALRAGNVREAAEQLGRSWSVRREVIDGQKLGRTIGYPTANMTLGALIEPRHGIYATRAIFDGKARDAVSSFGRRPTVSDGEPLLETYIFEFDGDLYGRAIEIEFVEFIRDEEKFDGLETLKAAIADDCEKARAILSATPAST
ncbi:MAG: bifunctional riboflavin kinase/FAD synthetase [Marinicaulis sp.]|nr:bifunctional riboflavin kinase/FAD synthetase [Marinicaulis sp.]